MSSAERTIATDRTASPIGLPSTEYIARIDVDVIGWSVAFVVKALHERPVVEGDRDPGRASLPDAHQPDGVEPERCQPLPLRVRHARKIDCPARPSAQLVEPRPRVDLVDERVVDHELSAPSPLGGHASDKYRQ